MKKLLCVALISTMLFVTGCSSHTTTETESESASSVSESSSSESTDISTDEASLTTEESSAESNNKAINISELTDEEIYALAVEYYDSGLFKTANRYFSEIPDYADSATYISNSDLLLSYQGVYARDDRTNTIYFIIHGNTLTEINLVYLEDDKATEYTVSQTLTENNGVPCFVSETRTVGESVTHTNYYYLTTQDGENAIQYDSDRNDNYSNYYSGYYTYTTRITLEELQAKVQAIEDMVDPAIGMTESEVLASTWGKPDDINKTTTKYGVREQWVYGNGKYIYLEDGIVTTIQE